MKKLTYNAIFDTHGEEVMLAYEKVVDAILEDTEYVIEAMQIAHHTANLQVAQDIIETAKLHAQQEIDESVANDFSAYVNMDLKEILK